MKNMNNRNDCQQIQKLFGKLLSVKVGFDNEIKDDKAYLGKFEVFKTKMESIIREIKERLPVSIRRAKGIFDSDKSEEDREKEKTDVLGPAEIKKAFGIELKSGEIPPIPFSEEELARAKELGQFLVLRLDAMPDGRPLNMLQLSEIVKPKFLDLNYRRVLDDDSYRMYRGDTFLSGGYGSPGQNFSAPKFGWALTTKEILPGSTSGRKHHRYPYLLQTEMLANYLKDSVFENSEIPGEFKEAIEEYDTKREKLYKLLSDKNFSEYKSGLNELKLNKIARQTPSEALYDILAYFLINNTKLLEQKFTYTNTTDSTSENIYIGFGKYDIYFKGWDGVQRSLWDNHVGVVFSRTI